MLVLFPSFISRAAAALWACSIKSWSFSVGERDGCDGFGSGNGYTAAREADTARPTTSQSIERGRKSIVFGGGIFYGWERKMKPVD